MGILILFSQVPCHTSCCWGTTNDRGTQASPIHISTSSSLPDEEKEEKEEEKEREEEEKEKKEEEEEEEKEEEVKDKQSILRVW